MSMQNNNDDDNNNNEIPERAGYFQGYVCHNANPSMKLIRYKLHYRKTDVVTEEIQSRGSFRDVVFILQEIRN